MQNPTKDRAHGLLVGLAVADQIGGPLNMALQLAESLIAMQRFDLGDVDTRYISWWRTEGFDTGPVANEVFRLRTKGIGYKDAARLVDQRRDGLTAGCNPAHRSPPLAMAAFLSDRQLPQVAKLEASLTHHHPLAGDVSAAVVALCRALIRGVAWDEALRTAQIGRKQVTIEALTPTTTAGSNGGFAPDVLAAAVHFVYHAATFTEALVSANRFAGPANYAPVLVGAIGGARWGCANIPHHLATHPATLPKAQSIAAQLASSFED